MMQAQQLLHARRVIFPVERAQNAVGIGDQQCDADRRLQPVEAKDLRWLCALLRAHGCLLVADLSCHGKCRRRRALFTRRMLASTRILTVWGTADRCRRPWRRNRQPPGYYMRRRRWP